jgi:mRNA-degrading endonuclease toxin of MazEF toxin-antitoxin module
VEHGDDRPHLHHRPTGGVPAVDTVAGRDTLVLVDQIRTIDTDYVLGEPVGYLTRIDMARIEYALHRYLGL